MANLEQFLRTGELGPIRPGMTESEVKSRLGSPPNWRDGSTPLMSFGALELAFCRKGAAEGELQDIGLSFSPHCDASGTPRWLKCSDSSGLSLEDFQLSSQTTLDEIRQFLDRVGLSKHVKSCNQEDMAYLVIRPPGARITFHDQKLWSVHFIDRGPPTKQVSFSVSEATWNQLKHLAQQSKKPVSAICAEWITQRAKDLQPVPEGAGCPE